VAYCVAVTERVTKRPSVSSAASSAALTKADKRAAAKAAKARALAAKKRRQTLSIVGATVVVLAVIVGIVLAVRSGTSKDPVASASGTTTATATTATATTATGPAAAPTSAVPFPPLPAGADPALGTKPATTAGTGTVTKLAVKTLIEGKGAPAKTGQNLNVNYVGVTYVDGKEFDSSWSRSQALPFQLGVGKVIQGWDQGLVGVKVGSRVQLDIPADLAYGAAPTDGSPAGALRFIVDVLSAT